MLFHHSRDAYDISASAAALSARTNFEALIAKGRASVGRTLERIESEVPDDYVVKANKALFAVGPAGGISFAHPIPNDDYTEGILHPHALKQAAARAGIPQTYVDRLMDPSEGDYKRELLAHNLREIYQHDDDRMLVRHVGGQVRGILSDRFRRMDSRPLLEAFLEVAGQYGAVPVDGVFLETRVALRVVLPMVFEPVDNEVLVYGISWGNSEYGDGALWMRTFVNRLWCTNFATLEEELRKIHLGKRLGDDLRLSENTRMLDLETLKSATKDIVAGALAPERVKFTLDGIKAANDEKVDSKAIGAFLKTRMNKEEAAATKEIFMSADVEHLPAGQNRWRLSNAISYLAGTVEDGSRRLQLQEIAGEALKSVLAA